VIVIDASALTKYILKEENWLEVSDYLKRGVLSVDHIIKEVGNAIWKHLTLRKIIDKDIANNLFKLLFSFIESKVLTLEPETKFLESAFKIAIDNEITLYDAIYLAQAKQYGELLTSDKNQSKVAEALGIKAHFIE